MESQIEQIVSPVDTSLLLQEIDFLRLDGSKLLSCKNYEVFLARKEKIPFLMHEIGRLREVTFREVGEGTNLAIDLDRFDEYFQHLFLWDNESLKLAGAYRMGIGQEIYPVYGESGFYITELFDFEEELHPFLQDSIEMGRAFVIKEYQQKPMPLFLLWKGILITALKYPEHKHLIGGVSISNRFSERSKSLILEFLSRYYLDQKVAKHIHPKLPYISNLCTTELESIFSETEDDLNKFDKLIAKNERESCLRLPVLIKKYIKQNSRVLAFNVDPLFNNAIDALIYINLNEVPDATINPVKEEFYRNFESIPAMH
jgi:putative hemolysin